MMLTEIPFLSQAVCYLTELGIIGNPIYPKFAYSDIRKNCTHAFECEVFEGLDLFVNSAKFKANVTGIAPWKQCDSII